MKTIQKCFSQLTDPSPQSSSEDVGQHDVDEDGEHGQRTGTDSQSTSRD